MITLIVRSAGCGIRGQLFDGVIDGRQVVTRSTQPLLDACRVLIADGNEPATRIVMRHAATPDVDALCSTVGAAAGLTVKDDSVGKPVFRPWSPSPFDRRAAVPVTAERGETDLLATLPAA